MIAVAFSPDGKTHRHRVPGQDGADSGTPPPAGSSGNRDGPRGRQRVAFSPDGKAVLTVSSDERRGCGTPPPAGRSEQPMVHRARVRSVAFSPDGKTVLTGGNDRTARLWEAPPAGPSDRPWHIGGVRSVAFSPDGRTILTGDRRTNGARLWDVDTGQPIGPPKPHAPTRCRAWRSALMAGSCSRVMCGRRGCGMCRRRSRRPAAAGRLGRGRHRAGAGRAGLDPHARPHRLAGAPAAAGATRRAAAADPARGSTRSSSAPEPAARGDA